MILSRRTRAVAALITFDAVAVAAVACFVVVATTGRANGAALLGVILVAVLAAMYGTVRDLSAEMLAAEPLDVDAR